VKVPAAVVEAGKVTLFPTLVVTVCAVPPLILKVKV
jgi:hypothetical protein